MIIIDPSVTEHTLKIMPRFYPIDALTVSLYNEASQVTSTPATTYNIVNGELNISFTFTFVDKDKHQIKIVDASSVVVYRGKITSTTQTAQDYKLTDGLYFYE